MWIKIDAEGSRFSFPVPIGLLINGFTLKLIKRWVPKYDFEIPITQEQLVTILSELKKAKKTFPKLTLVDVKTGDGQRVLITL